MSGILMGDVGAGGAVEDSNGVVVLVSLRFV